MDKKLTSRPIKPMISASADNAVRDADLISIRAALTGAFNILQDRFLAGFSVSGLSTGYAELDEITAGFQSGSLIILAARPAMGKSMFALNIAGHTAVKSGKAALVFSMGMSASQVALNLISAYGRVKADCLRTGQLEDEDWNRVVEAIKLLKDTNILIYEASVLTQKMLVDNVRWVKSKHDLGLVVVDSLQDMFVNGKENASADAMSKNTSLLRDIAREFGVPVLVLSQLSRSTGSRTDERPSMTDLWRLGAIEQYADLVLLIYRDDYYDRQSAETGLAEIIIGKNRYGSTGKVKLKFSGEVSRFDNLCESSHHD